MNITQVKTGELTARLNIEIVEQDYQENYQQELKKFRKQAAIPGFRQGKVPQSLIEKKYGPSVLAEEINKIITKSLDDFIKNEKLNILGYPIPVEEQEAPDFVHLKDFLFSFDYAITPNININLTQEETAEYLTVEVTEEIINNTVKDLQKQFANPIDVQNIDSTSKIQVYIKETDIDGNVLEGGIGLSTHFDFSLITNDDIKNLLTGLSAGDKVFFNPLIAFGAEKASKILGISLEKANTIDTDFEVEVMTITHNEPAELDQEFFEKAFPAEVIADYESFIERIRKAIKGSYAQDEDKFFVNRTLQQLVKSTNIEIPDEFTKRWLFVSNDGKISKEAIEKEYPLYRQSMIIQLIEKELMKQYPEIIVYDEDIKEEVKRFYRQYFGFQKDAMEEHKASLDKIAENLLKNKEESGKIYEMLFTQRMLTLFKSKLTIIEKETTIEEFSNEMKKLYASEHSHQSDSHVHDHDHDEHTH